MAYTITMIKGRCAPDQPLPKKDLCRAGFLFYAQKMQIFMSTGFLIEKFILITCRRA